MRSRRATSLISSIICTVPCFLYNFVNNPIINIQSSVWGWLIARTDFSIDGRRKADLLIKTTPRWLQHETLLTAKQKPIIEFRLFDSNTNKSFNHVNYYISIDKEGKKLISNWFHSHEGDLGIKIIPTNTTKTRLSWTAGTSSGRIYWSGKQSNDRRRSNIYKWWHISFCSKNWVQLIVIHVCFLLNNKVSITVS